MTLTSIVFIDKNEQVLVTMSHKDFQGIKATVERVNTGHRLAGPREIYEVTSNDWEMNQGAFKLQAPQQTIQAIFLCPARRTNEARKFGIFGLTHVTEGSTALDLDTYISFTLSPKVKCYQLTNGVYGSLPSGRVGTILRISGSTSQGIVVYPDVVDG